MNYLYHLLPPGRKIEGDFLLPLNKLKIQYPEIYRNSIVKYYDLVFFDFKVVTPIIKCSYFDFIYFTAIDIFLYKKENPNLKINFLRIEAEKLNQSNLFVHHKHLASPNFFPDKFHRFDIKDIKTYSDVPEINKKIFPVNDMDKFLFYGMPRILHYGEILIQDLEFFRL